MIVKAKTKLIDDPSNYFVMQDRNYNFYMSWGVMDVVIKGFALCTQNKPMKIMLKFWLTFGRKVE